MRKLQPLKQRHDRRSEPFRLPLVRYAGDQFTEMIHYDRRPGDRGRMDGCWSSPSFSNRDIIGRRLFFRDRRGIIAFVALVANERSSGFIRGQDFEQPLSAFEPGPDPQFATHVCDYVFDRVRRPATNAQSLAQPGIGILVREISSECRAVLFIECGGQR